MCFQAVQVSTRDTYLCLPHPRSSFYESGGRRSLEGSDGNGNGKSSDGSDRVQDNRVGSALSTGWSGCGGGGGGIGGSGSVRGDGWGNSWDGSVTSGNGRVLGGSSRGRGLLTGGQNDRGNSDGGSDIESELHGCREWS